MDIRNIDMTVNLLSRTMDIRLKNHGVIASNIANAETPGYSAKQLAFETELEKAATASKRAVSGMTEEARAKMVRRVDGKVIDVPDRPATLDGNTVDIDKQMARLSDNTLSFMALSQMLYQRLNLLKQVIDVGGV